MPRAASYKQGPTYAEFAIRNSTEAGVLLLLDESPNGSILDLAQSSVISVLQVGLTSLVNLLRTEEGAD